MNRVLSWKSCAVLAILAVAIPADAAEGLHWETDLAAAQQMARQSNRLVWIHFGGPWCGPCMMLERNVFSQPGFGRDLTDDYVAVKIDPRSSAEAQAIAKKYGIDRVPFDVVTRPSGQVVLRMQSPTEATGYSSTWKNVARQELPERRDALVAAAPAPNSPSQVGGQPAGGSQLATQPADNRYADYYNRRPAMQREPYQPPVQGQELPTSPPADRSADRYADRSADPAASHSPAAAADRSTAQNRYSQQQPGAGYSGQGASANQPSPNQRTPYGGPVASIGGQPRLDLQHDRSVDESLAAGPSSLEAKIPPGNPPLALEGYCPVTLMEHREWQEGDPKIGVIHRQRLYLFANQAAQQRFLANPDNYSPVCRGHDPVLVLDQNQAVPGRREFGVFYGDRIYLFANEATRTQFEQNPKRYSAEIMQAMRQ
jgi:YHS domain-containing protein/thiol-disulfide isomerase/thioredoxin